MSLGVVGTTTGATGGDVGGDTHDTAAASQVQQTPFVTGTNSLGDANTTFAGAGANDTFGSALAHGDLNGDGVEDVVVAAPENDSADGNNSGAVYVFYGPVEDGDIDAESANVTLHGVEAGDRAGYAVAAGDVDDDGTDDLVVGAPLEDTNGQSAGTAYVVYGGDDLPENDSLSTADHVLRGESEGDRAGWSVAAVNRTGGDDVLVGAPGNASADDTGAAYVVSDAEPGVDSLANATATLTGEAEGDVAGWAVAEAGDFDGDGSQDVLVSAPRNNSTADDAGAAYLVTENVTGTVSLADARLKLAGEAARDRAGWDVAEAGDVNNDSYDDLVVGAPFAETADSETNAGIAYVVYGGEDDAGTVNLSEAGATLAGSGEDDLAGYSVSSAGSGDVTCDDYADVLVGAPGNNSTAVDAGAVYLVAGSEFPATERNLSDADATLVGEGEGDRAGTAVSDAMDVTGDGDEDILVGAPLNDSSAVDAGAAYLLAGDCPEPKDDDEEEPSTTTTGEPTTTEKPTKTTTTPVGPPDDDDGGGDDRTTTTTEEPEPEDVIVTKECIDEQGKVTVTNPNDERVTFTIEGDSYTLTASGTDGDSITLSDLDDGDYEWTAKTESGDHVGGGTLTVDCDREQPEPEDVLVSLECVDEQGELTVINPNDQNVTFTIEGDSYTLTANGTANDTLVLDDLDDGDYEWTAETEDGTNVGGGTLTVDCDPLNVIASSPECGQLQLENPTDERVYVQFIDQDQPGNEGEFILEPGETATKPFGGGDVKLTASTGSASGADPGETVLVNGNESTVLSIDECPPEEPPAGSIVDVTCENVTLAANNVSQGALTFLVEFEDGTNTTVTVETDNGSFSGTVPFDNPDNKNISGVFLYAGNDTDTEPEGVLDDVDLDGLSCAPEQPPEYNPNGRIVETTCQNVTIDVENITEGFVTVVVGYEDDTTENITVQTDNGSFSGTVSISNPDDKNISTVDLFAGEPGEGPPEQFIDDKDPFLDCSPEEPRGTQDSVAVSEDCEQLTVRNPSSNDENVDFRIRNSSGDLVATVDDVAPGGDETVSGLEAGDYTVDARYVTDDQFSSDNVTVNGQTQATVPVDPCPVACPSGLAAKWNEEDDYALDLLEGASESEFDVSVSGDAESATVTNNEDYDVEVWVFAGSGYEKKGTAEAGGTLTVGGIATTNPQGQPITLGISNIAVVCVGEGPPNIPPYNNQSPQPATPPNFDVSISNTNSPVTEGEDLAVDVDVENTGGEQGTQTIELVDIGGDVVDTQEVTLGSGASTSFTLNWSTETGDADTGDVTVNSDDDSDTSQVTIQAPQSPASFDISISDTNSPVTEGDPLTVQVTIENTGDQQGTQTVQLLDSSNNELDSQEVTLAGGESTSVTLTWQTMSSDAGSTDVIASSENDSDTASIEIQAGNQAPTDADGDGSPAGPDCDDNDDTVYPGAPELDDGKDNDCDGTVDEGITATGDDSSSGTFVTPVVSTATTATLSATMAGVAA